MTMAIDKNVARGLNTLGYWVGTFFKVTPDNSYPTGGYSFPASLVKLGVIEYMAPIMCPKTSDGSKTLFAQYNYSTGKLQFYWEAGAAVAPANLLITGGQAAGVAIQVTPDSNAGVLGKTTAGNITIPVSIGGGAAGQIGPEVDNGTDLSAYSGRGLVFGRG